MPVPDGDWRPPAAPRCQADDELCVSAGRYLTVRGGLEVQGRCVLCGGEAVCGLRVALHHANPLDALHRLLVVLRLPFCRVHAHLVRSLRAARLTFFALSMLCLVLAAWRLDGTALRLAGLTFLGFGLLSRFGLPLRVCGRSHGRHLVRGIHPQALPTLRPADGPS